MLFIVHGFGINSKQLHRSIGNTSQHEGYMVSLTFDFYP
jgi:hypothetical protein